MSFRPPCRRQKQKWNLMDAVSAERGMRFLMMAYGAEIKQVKRY